MNLKNRSSIKEKFLSLFPEDEGVSALELDRIEELLSVKLPRDFREICSFYSGGMVGEQNIFTITSNLNDDYGLVKKTLLYRKIINLPNKYIVLYDEYGFIILDTNSSTEDSPILDISSTDIFALIEGRLSSNNFLSYKSFSEYFQYLLEQEEIERDDS